MRTRLLALGLGACVIGGASEAYRYSVRETLRQADAADHLALLTPGPPNAHAAPPEIGMLAPYRVESAIAVRESGGPGAQHEFVDDATRTLVRVAIHRCRPLAAEHGLPASTINLVDGSDHDPCTSGGAVELRDLDTGDELQIRFKLIGAPNGTISWDAERLAADPRWFDRLQRLEGSLSGGGHSTSELPGMPGAVADGERIALRDHADPDRVLMEGPRDDVHALLQFRNAFREFYDAQNDEHSGRIAAMVIERLLESDEQRELTGEWQRYLRTLDEATAGATAYAALGDT
ncbi:MAG: hypothetical protein KF774_12870 [Planctomyces sp.]|nr:hypothetical protein [Planctomyces sp.]